MGLTLIFVTFFVTLKLKKALQISVTPFSAESEGFEPPDPLRSTVFKTAAFDHSANSPKFFDVGFASAGRISLSKGIAKIGIISESANFYLLFSSSFEKNLYWKIRR